MPWRATGSLLLSALAVSLFAAADRADADLVAPRSECAGQRNAEASEPGQEDAMRCLINYARRGAGAGALDSNQALERAAGRKAGDVMRCGFSHTACGRPADLYPRRFGYTSGSFRWGENLALGTGKRGTARKVMKAWLDSPPHRDTMLSGSFDDLGIGLRRSGNTAVWVLEVGCRGC